MKARARYLGNQDDQKEDDEITDTLKYEREFKAKLMDAEYEKIIGNVELVEKYCESLDNKVVKFRTNIENDWKELHAVDTEEIGLNIADLKEKIEDGKATLKKINRTQTMHSDDQKCNICGAGHSSRDCTGEDFTDRSHRVPRLDMTDGKDDKNRTKETLNTNRSKNSKEKTKKKKIQETAADKLRAFEQNRLKHMDPELLKDMMERKRILEQKKKEREWAKMSKKEKTILLENAAREKHQKMFEDQADTIRNKVKKQYDAAIINEEEKDED